MTQYEMNLSHSGNGTPMSERCSHGRAGWEWCHWCDQASTAATRREAEAKIAPKRNKLREEVYECIRDNGPGVTDEQIAELTGMNPSTARPSARVGESGEDRGGRHHQNAVRSQGRGLARSRINPGAWPFSPCRNPIVA
jgi:hypothetical protein